MQKFQKIEGLPVPILHLWYPLSDVQELIDMRTSYLGSFRRSEDAPHLLDLIRMSKDETNMFEELAREAMDKVFPALSKYTKYLRMPAYRFNEENGDEFDSSFHFIIIYPPFLSRQYLEPLDSSIRRALAFLIISNWVQDAFPDESERWAVKAADALNDVYDNANMMIPQPYQSVGRWF